MTSICPVRCLLLFFLGFIYLFWQQQGYQWPCFLCYQIHLNNRYNLQNSIVCKWDNDNDVDGTLYNAGQHDAPQSCFRMWMKRMDEVLHIHVHVCLLHNKPIYDQCCRIHCINGDANSTLKRYFLTFTIDLVTHSNANCLQNGEIRRFVFLAQLSFS